MFFFHGLAARTRTAAALDQYVAGQKLLAALGDGVGIQAGGLGDGAVAAVSEPERPSPAKSRRCRSSSRLMNRTTAALASLESESRPCSGSNADSSVGSLRLSNCWRAYFGDRDQRFRLIVNKRGSSCAKREFIGLCSRWLRNLRSEVIHGRARGYPHEA